MLCGPDYRRQGFDGWARLCRACEYEALVCCPGSGVLCLLAEALLQVSTVVPSTATPYFECKHQAAKEAL